MLAGPVLKTSLPFLANAGRAAARNVAAQAGEDTLLGSAALGASRITRPTLASVVSNLFSSVVAQPALARVAYNGVARMNNSISAREAGSGE